MTTSPYETLSMGESLEALSSLLRHIKTLALQSAEDEVEDLRKALEQLSALNNAKATLREAHAAYESTLAKEMDGIFQVDLPGGLVAERREGAPRKSWQHQSLGKEVAKRIVQSSIDMDTGEMYLSTEEMVAELLRYAAPSYWRVKQLKTLGIDPDKYCETGDPKISVVIKKG